MHGLDDCFNCVIVFHMVSLLLVGYFPFPFSTTFVRGCWLGHGRSYWYLIVSIACCLLRCDGAVMSVEVMISIVRPGVFVFLISGENWLIR